MNSSKWKIINHMKAKKDYGNDVTADVYETNGWCSWRLIFLSNEWSKTMVFQCLEDAICVSDYMAKTLDKYGPSDLLITDEQLILKAKHDQYRESPKMELGL